MPLIDFKCSKCGEVKEVLIKKQVTEQTCVCGSAMEKQISGSNFKLSGSGWFKDGYSKK